MLWAELRLLLGDSRENILLHCADTNIGSSGLSISLSIIFLSFERSSVFGKV